MFSPDVNFRWRMRPVPRNLIQAELAAIETGTSVRKLGGSALYAELVDGEWRETNKIMFREWGEAEIEARPIDLAEQIGGGLSLAGFSHRTLFEARKRLLDAVEFQEQLDTLRQWHERRSLTRPFRVLSPLAQSGTLPVASGMTEVPLAEIEPAIVEKIHEAVAAEHCVLTPTFLVAQVRANDRTGAALRFAEDFDRYRLRLLQPLRPVELAQGSLIVHDAFPPPDGETRRIPMPARFEYTRPSAPTTKVMLRILAAAKVDPVIDTVLDQYLLALRELDDGSVRAAFQAVLPLLDVGFDCEWSPPTGRQHVSAFGRRTIALASALLAVSLPRATFNYLHEYLRQTTSLTNRFVAIPGKRNDANAYLAITDARSWRRIAAVYEWNGLLLHRRREFMAMVANPGRAVGDAWKKARWDIGRAIRARHAFAHRGEPMTDSHVLAVALEIAYLCLVARCSAVEHGVTFGELMGRVEASVRPGGPSPDWPTYIVEGEWAIARVFLPSAQLGTP